MIESPPVWRSVPIPPMSPSSEQTQWFTEQVKPHEPLLRGYLQKRFPSLPDHDDIVQEAYARLLRADKNGPQASAKGFLFTVARNIAIDLLRRRQAGPNEPFSERSHQPVMDEVPDVADALEHQRRREVLIEAIASLPLRCR